MPLPAESGQSSTPRLLNETLLSPEYWIARSKPGDDVRESIVPSSIGVGTGETNTAPHACLRLTAASSRAVVPIKQDEGVI
jgi:hypothetical protein